MSISAPNPPSDMSPEPRVGIARADFDGAEYGKFWVWRLCHGSCEAHTGSECPPNVRRQPEVGWQRGATIAKRDGPGTGRVERGLSHRQSCLKSYQGAIHDKDNLSDVLGEHKYTEN